MSEENPEETEQLLDRTVQWLIENAEHFVNEDGESNTPDEIAQKMAEIDPEFYDEVLYGFAEENDVVVSVLWNVAIKTVCTMWFFCWMLFIFRVCVNFCRKS